MYSMVLFAGGFVLSLVALLVTLFSYRSIDSVLGEEAGGSHFFSYIADVILFFPVMMGIYIAIIWLLTWRIKPSSPSVQNAF